MIQDLKKLVTAVALLLVVAFITTVGTQNTNQLAAVSSSGSYIQKTIGEQKVAVFLIDDIHDGQEQSIDSIRDVFLNGEYSLNEYLKEVSYGKTWISADIFGWYDIRTLSGLGECVMPTFEQALSLASNDQRDLRQYDRVFLMYRSKVGCRGGGQNYGERTIPTSDGIIKIGLILLVVQERDYIADTRIEGSIPHEFVHNMGIRAHANAYSCGDETLSTTTTKCTQVHYGDPFDILGHTRSHPNVCFKRALGWVDSSNLGLRQITSSGTYAVYPQEIATSPGAKGLEIKLTKPISLNQPGRYDADAFDSLFIETRTIVGKFSLHPSYAPYLNGIFIRGGQYGVYGDKLNTADQYDMQCAPTFLLDSTPGSFDEFDDAAFTLGQSFYEPTNGVRITPKTIRSDGGIDVEILFDSVDTIKPIVSITSPYNWSRVRNGTSKVLSARATDNVGVTNVRFVVNGVTACQDSTPTYGIYSCSWFVPSKASVTYTIYAQAYDAKNNIGVSKSIYVISR